jgi:hypothetical protein
LFAIAREFNALTHEAAGKVTRALVGYRKDVRFYALMNVLLMAMAYDPVHLERMAEFIGGLIQRSCIERQLDARRGRAFCFVCTLQDYQGAEAKWLSQECFFMGQ